MLVDSPVGRERQSGRQQVRTENQRLKATFERNFYFRVEKVPNGQMNAILFLMFLIEGLWCSPIASNEDVSSKQRPVNQS